MYLLLKSIRSVRQPATAARKAIQSNTTPDQDTLWESDKNTRKHHKQESHKVSSFPAYDHKAARDRQNSMTYTKHNNKNNPQKKHRLVTVIKNNWRALTCLTVPTSPLFLMWLMTDRCLVFMTTILANSLRPWPLQKQDAYLTLMIQSTQ